MTSLKKELLNHIFKYCEQENYAIDKEEVLSDFDDFLVRINAPNELGGFAHLIVMLTNVNKVSQEIGDFLLKELHCAPYIYEALDRYNVNISRADDKKEFNRLTLRKGWCQDFPFYVLLIKSRVYKNDQKSTCLLAAFIKQYFQTIETLTDPDLNTGTASREYEACTSFRLIMKMTDMDFDPQRDFILSSYDDVSESIADNIDHLIDEQQSDNYSQNHLRILRHFFRNSWKPVRNHNRGGNTQGRLFKRYRTAISIPIVGDSNDIFALLPSKPLIPDSDGFDEDDYYPSQTYVIDNKNITEKRDKTKLLATELLFNRSEKMKKEIDITSNVRRSHNMGVQNSQLIMPAELNFLVSKLLAYGNRESTRELAIVAWIMLLLCKSVSEVKGLVAFRDLKSKKQGLYIDPDGNGWWYFHVEQSAKARMDQDGLKCTTRALFTACPHFLTELILIHVEGQFDDYIVKVNDVQSIEIRLTKTLKKLSDRHGSGRLSLRRLTNFVSYYINSTEVIDPIYIDFSYAVNMYTTRVSRSYANVTDKNRCKQLKKLWGDVETSCKIQSGIEIPISLFDLKLWSDKDTNIGSSFTPKEASVQRLISGLLIKIEESKPSYYNQMNDLFAYHNAFTVYTAWMLLFGTGYRAAWNPLPTLSLFVPSLNLMCISDKDDSDFTHSRIVAVSSTLTSQLNEYKRHLKCLRGMLRILKPDLCGYIDRIVDVDQLVLNYDFDQASKWYKTIRNSRTEHGPFFVFLKQKSGVVTRSLSPTQLVNMFDDVIKLPLNAGRHWLKSRLLEMETDSELINFQVGHWQAGEVPLGDYSALSHIEAIQELLPTIDELFLEVGWQPIQSVLS